MLIFLGALFSIMILFGLGFAIFALVERSNIGKEITALPAKEGEDAPADQPVPRQELAAANMASKSWQAVSAFLLAVIAALGLFRVSKHAKRERVNPKLKSEKSHA